VSGGNDDVIAVSSLSVEWNADYATKPSAAPTDRDREIDSLVISYLEHRGIFGCDEDEAIMSIADTDEDNLSEDEVEAAVERLVLSGEVTRDGCHGLALSLSEWSARLAKAAGNPGAASALRDILTGST
jgi:hypothetical protein